MKEIRKKYLISMAYHFGFVDKQVYQRVFSLSSGQVHQDMKEFSEYLSSNKVEHEVKYGEIQFRFAPKRLEQDLYPLDKTLSDMLGDRFIEMNEHVRSRIDPVTSSTVMEIVAKKQAMKVQYVSLTNGTSDRHLCVHSVFSAQSRIYLRGFDYDKNVFRTFHLDRIKKCSGIQRPYIDSSHDTEWNTFVEIEIVVDPALSSDVREQVKTEFMFEDGTLKTITRKPLELYVQNLLATRDNEKRPFKIEVRDVLE